MSMTQDEADILIAGIERIFDEAQAAEEIAQVTVARGPGPGPRVAERWQFSCPYCTAHGDYQPLNHDEDCPYHQPTRVHTRKALVNIPTQGLIVWAEPSHIKSFGASPDAISANLDAVKASLQKIAEALGPAPSTTKTSKFSIEFGLSVTVKTGQLTSIAIGGVEGDAHLTVTMEWGKTGR